MAWALFSRALAQSQKFISHHAWGAGTIVFFLLLKASGVTQIWSLNQLDWMLRLRPEESIDPNIIIVAIDQSYQAWLREQHGDRSYLEYQDLAELTELILAQEPTIVALDIPKTSLSGQGKDALLEQFREQGSKMVATEKSLRPFAPPISGLLDNQVASNDLITDPDGKIRRAFIGTYGEGETFKKSLSFHISELYLETQHEIESNNGLIDEKTVRFSDVEIPRLKPHQEPYSRYPNETEGVQTLIHYRQQPRPFQSISAQTLMKGDVEPARLRDKIVLVGITAPDLTKYVNTSVPRQKLAADSALQHQVSGIELQAHAISQMVSAILDENRVLLRGTHWLYSYVLILGAGMLGLLLGRSSQNILYGLLVIAGVMIFAGGGLWLLLMIYGVYVSAGCAFFTFAMTGMGSAIALQQEIARQESEKRKNMEIQAARQEVEAREALLAERLKTLEDTFAELHNGPLQMLALLLRQLQDRQISIETVEKELQGLNRQIRDVGEHLKQEAKVGERQILLHGDQAFELSQPLHELFYDVYYQSLQSGWPNFQNLQVRSRSFDPVPETQLTSEDKQALCQFLREALSNVGKHAEGATRLIVSGKASPQDYVLSIQDNGHSLLNGNVGDGTRQAQKLAKRLNGNFSRNSLLPQGVACMLRWPVEKD